MAALNEAYAPAIALDGWNYIRYLGPFTKPPPEPVFLRVHQGELVVATGREASKLWAVVRLRAPEDDINRHACALKREGTQTFIGYRLYPSEGRGELFLGPQERLDVFRVTRMQKPSYIRLYQAPLEECCDPGGDDAQTQIAGPSDDGNDAAGNPGSDDTQTQIAGPSDDGNDTGENPGSDDTQTQIAGPSDDGNDAAEMSVETVAKPDPPAPVEWYLGISADLKVVIKPFPPMAECSAEMASERPVWEFTSREEAIRQDYPSFSMPKPIPSQANNPRSVEYYTRPDRFKKYDRDFWPGTQRRT